MRVGILGSGLMGGKLGTLFARAGHEVVFSYARSKEKLEGFARDAGRNARAGTPGEAAREADALLLAVHWSRIDDVLKQAGDLSGSVLVSCSLPLNADNTELVVARPRRGRRNLQRRFRRLGSSPHSTRCPAKCFSACTKPSARPAVQVWCTAARIGAAKL